MSVTGRSRAGLAWRLLALAALVGAGAWAYHANVVVGRPAMDMGPRAGVGAAALPVTVAPVERGRVAGTVVYTGTVAPFAEEDIYPRVAGRIVELPVYPGDAVRPGQVVARLDDVELGSRVAEAEAAARAAAASLAQMEADVLGARHGVTQMEREVAMARADVAAARAGAVQMQRELAMAEAEASYQEPLLAREERLFHVGAVSRQDVENARAMAAATRAKVQAAAAKVAQAGAMIEAARAKAEAAQARLDQAHAMETSALRKREAMAAMAQQSQAQLQTARVVRDYVSLQAPSGGYVVKRLVAPGVLVQPGMAILKLARIDRVRLQANVGERDVAAIRVGVPVTVTRTGAGQDALAATVTSVAPFVDPGARTAVVEAVVDNAGRRYLPGQYVTMEFVVGERSGALAVPRTAVSRMGGKARVWVVEDDRAQPREVTTGLEGGDRVEIVAGLAGTERIVVRGHEGLYAGARVADRSAAPPAAAGHGGHGAPAAPEAGARPERPPAPSPGPATPAVPAKPEGGSHEGH